MRIASPAAWPPSKPVQPLTGSPRLTGGFTLYHQKKWMSTLYLITHRLYLLLFLIFFADFTNKKHPLFEGLQGSNCLFPEIAHVKIDLGVKTDCGFYDQHLNITREVPLTMIKTEASRFAISKIHSLTDTGNWLQPVHLQRNWISSVPVLSAVQEMEILREAASRPARLQVWSKK